ncbi:hypothetical protein [Demequina litorisediminis]|nr:hypothetical protein [Demequina litorisediminis]
MVGGVGVLAVIVAIGVLLWSPADAPPSATGAIPDSKISAQLFDYFYYIGFGEDDETRARQDEVLASLADAGYRSVEVVDYAGFHGLDAQQYRDVLDGHGLEASALHTSVTMGTSDEQWAQKVDTALILGADFVGAGETPRDFTARGEWVEFAQRIDEPGPAGPRARAVVPRAPP